MKFVDTLKDITRKREDYKESVMDNDIAAEIRRDPQYAKVLNKLQELSVEREQLVNRLRKIELDIDTCLVLIDINQERKELSKDEEG